jgi:hypothetical protein
VFYGGEDGGQNFTFFNLKITISTHTNNFCGGKKKGPNFPDLKINKNKMSSNVYNGF